jgi:nucleoside-diphosphate-sugar epimerase
MPVIEAQRASILVPHDHRHISQMRTAQRPATSGRRVPSRAPWPVGPLLEPGASAVTGEPDDPQIAVLLAGRIPIADLGPDHRRRAVNSKDASDQGEDLVRAGSRAWRSRTAAGSRLRGYVALPIVDAADFRGSIRAHQCYDYLGGVVHPQELPVSARRREPRPLEPIGRRPRVLITGSAGVVATVLARDLSADHDLTGLDLRPTREPDRWDAAITASVGDRNAVLKAAAEVEYVLHLAHGSYEGWDGLREVDIDGTRNVLDGAMRGCCRRVVIGSTNHVVGWSELDYLAGYSIDLPLGPSSPPRPDGLYGAAKIAGEALGRAAAEFAGLPVSVLRIGTVRLDDNVERAVDENEFAYIGDRQAIRRRLDRTWLYHADLVRQVREEFAAPETFRLRYAVSAESEVWSMRPLAWTAPPVADVKRDVTT